ncbi:hypothetical protein F5878DRAFT_645584 [Lentinula raphanica]|uniref:Uncharacterized protein n=1 Tax=Lentinula raphanica TaxID=153919 RepID=A0AA38P081_9AGAR|nr:hypothetical protein F5878DRAFT_645584 [Lentinula raphanica]
MTPTRSETSSQRSTASRRALAIFVLSAVLSSSVLAAPTINPRSPPLTFESANPSSIASSSGLGPLSGGGRSDWYPEEVDHSVVVALRHAGDSLQAFKDSDDHVGKDGIDGSDLNLLVSASSKQRVDLSKRDPMFFPKPLTTEQLREKDRKKTISRLKVELESNAKKYKEAHSDISKLVPHDGSWDAVPGAWEDEGRRAEIIKLKAKYLEGIDQMYGTALEADSHYIAVEDYGGVSKADYEKLFEDAHQLVSEIDVNL